MPDIHIQRGYREHHVICAVSDVGKKWMQENLMSVVTEAQTEQVPIASEYAEEIAEKIRLDGLEVDVD